MLRDIDVRYVREAWKGMWIWINLMPPWKLWNGFGKEGIRCTSAWMLVHANLMQILQEVHFLGIHEGSHR